ncbi:MAG TPA: hypothetical protein VJ852_08055 [Gemmatimonadaceae bacterium]|nr:hypothetical protein [Gemmatimonadaceae bacterium]
MPILRRWLRLRPISPLASRFPLPAFRLPPLASLLPLLAACVADSTDRQITVDTTHVGTIVTATPVNRGTQGMRERVRWAFSPDRKAILVIADPVGVENEPVPNGFFFGDETRAFQTQMDSVWDVSVSPNWKWIGFGRAYKTSGAEGSGENFLTDVARRTQIDSATVRAASFVSSGMSGQRSIAQAGVIRVPDNPRAATSVEIAAPKFFPVALGWRVRWTTDGSTLALGNNPGRANDDDSSQTWAALDPTTGQLHGSLPGDANLAELKFTEGPTLELSTPIDLSKSPPIEIRRGTARFYVESERGVITIAQRSSPTSNATSQRVVGAGMALAATLGGRYVVALAPKSPTVQNEMAVEPVVYTVVW